MMMQKMQRRCQVGIQPIDLQTIYAQMEKVGKMQGAEQSAIAATRERQEEANKTDAQKWLNSVRDAEATDTDKISVNEHTARGDTSAYNSNKKKAKSETEKDEEDHYIKDPKLGLRVDISG